jgi:pimeloyl-ACP methyl ester carboxylesterase
MIAMATSRVDRIATSQEPASPSTAPTARAGIGWVEAVSLATGLLAALLLVAAPFIPAEESALPGAILCGFALGWAMLAVLSVRFTDQPQRWAAAPALFMGLSGLLLVAFGSSVNKVLDWVWPPALLVLVIWMILRARRQSRSRTRRWLLYPVLVVLAFASVGGGYQTLGAAADARAHRMPGQLIDVGGHRLHMNCTGSGSPTVVLEPGAGGVSSDFGLITPAVARDTRVCVYDRAGRGWSEPSHTPQDARQISTDLHTLLHRGQIPGPYVLAGHSFGGFYVLTFAARYPEEVAGMVLVDSTDRASAAEPRTAAPYHAGSYDVLGRFSALVSTSARLGLGRLVGVPTASQLRSTIDEYVQANASAEEAAALRSFADKPLIVLTAGVGSDAKHVASQNDLATLSTNTAHRVVEGASHADLIADEHGAATTTRAILDVVRTTSSHTQLK